MELGRLDGEKLGKEIEHGLTGLRGEKYPGVSLACQVGPDCGGSRRACRGVRT